MQSYIEKSELFSARSGSPAFLGNDPEGGGGQEAAKKL